MSDDAAATNPPPKHDKAAPTNSNATQAKVPKSKAAAAPNDDSKTGDSYDQDMNALRELDSTLYGIEAHCERGMMKAFGKNEQKILYELEELIKEQTSLSVDHLKLESTSHLGDQDLDNTDDVKFEKVGSFWEEKEKDVRKLSSDLQTISKRITSINKKFE